MIKNIPVSEIREKLNNLNNSSVVIKANHFKEQIVFSEFDNNKNKTSETPTLPKAEIIDKLNTLNGKSITVKADHFKEQVNFKDFAKTNSEKNPNQSDFKIFDANENLEVNTVSPTPVKQTSGNDYITDNIEKAKSQIKEIRASGANENAKGTTINLDYMYVISDAISAVENKKLFSPAQLDNVHNILSKVISGNPLNKEELIKLKEFSGFIVNNSEKLGLKKADFQKLSSLVDGSLKAQENLADKKDVFLKEANVVGEKIDTLIKLVSDPSLKADANLVEMLTTLQSKYKNILASGNPIAIEMFSAYMDKITQTMQDIKDGKEKDPQIFRKLQDQYDKATDNFFQFMAKDQMPPTDFMTSFLGNKAQAVVSMISSRIKEAGAEGSAKPSLQSFGKEMSSLLKFTPKEDSVMSKVSLNSVRQVMKNEKVANALSDFSHSLKSLDQDFSKLAKAYEDVEKKNKELSDYLSSSEFNKQFEDISSKSSFINKIINEQINNLLRSIDELESKLDFTIDSSEANIADLLETFRAIISKLDLDIRDVNQGVQDNKDIDEKNSKQVSENKNREQRFNVKREEALKQSIEAAKLRFSKTY